MNWTTTLDCVLKVLLLSRRGRAQPRQGSDRQKTICSQVRPLPTAGTLQRVVSTSLEREFFIDNLLVRIHSIIVMIRWAGLAPREFEFTFPGSRTSTFLSLQQAPENIACFQTPHPDLQTLFQVADVDGAVNRQLQRTSFQQATENIACFQTIIIHSFIVKCFQTPHPDLQTLFQVADADGAVRGAPPP